MIGFCFSFPVEQTAVDAGRLLAWTKGYENPGAVGACPAKLLQEAFRRKVPALPVVPASCLGLWSSCLVWLGSFPRRRSVHEEPSSPCLCLPWCLCP